jgi:DNA-binding SARP family transcriptional activator
LANRENALALQAAAEVESLEPFRETGWQRLMRVHAVVGNRAEALRAYEQCRTLLTDELGTDPSPQTEALYLDLLRSPSVPSE